MKKVSYMANDEAQKQPEQSFRGTGFDIGDLILIKEQVLSPGRILFLTVGHNASENRTKLKMIKWGIESSWVARIYSYDNETIYKWIEKGDAIVYPVCEGKKWK